MKGRAAGLVVGLMGCVLMTAGVAAADRCHKVLPGTRSLTLSADVTSYRFSGRNVVIDWARSAGCTGATVWRYASKARMEASVSCQRPAFAHDVERRTKLVASDATQTVRVFRAPASSDAPDRLIVRDRRTNRRVASWPLFERPAHVSLDGDLAILASAARQGLYALRISDGRIAQIGIARAGDRPLIGPPGILYQDDLDFDKHRTAPGERTLKLLPLATVRQELRRPFLTVRKYMSYSRPTVTTVTDFVSAVKTPQYRGADPARPFRSGRITAISMDGPRVALAVRDRFGRCDHVLFWNVVWHYVTRLTRASGPTCLPTHAPGGITNVAIAGSRALWTTSYGGETRVLAASITDCQEWVVARPRGGERVAGLAGDGITLAYAVRGLPGTARETASVGVVPKHWRGFEIRRSTTQVAAISANRDRVAVLYESGVARIVTRRGRSVGAIRVGEARAVSLRPGTLAVLTRHATLDIYSTASRKRIHSWRVPTGATSLDVHYRIALLTAGRDVFVVNIDTGRTARVMHAPARVSAQLEGPGAAIQFNTQKRGHLRFLPMTWIEARAR